MGNKKNDGQICYENEAVLASCGGGMSFAVKKQTLDVFKQYDRVYITDPKAEVCKVK